MKIKPEKSGLSAKKALRPTAALVEENRDGESSATSKTPTKPIFVQFSYGKTHQMFVFLIAKKKIGA